MKKVIYTCITGAYDTLIKPPAIRLEWDYICFTDAVDTPGSNGVWKLVPLSAGQMDNAAASRYPKLLPHRFLADYDLSLYIDPNISISNDAFYEEVAKKLQAPISMVPHGIRDCIYEEILSCYLAGHCRFRDAYRLKKKLNKDGIPPHYGFYENNIILRQHNSPKIIELDEAWWDAYINGIHRDQLHLMPLLYRMGIKPEELLPDGQNARNCPWLEYRMHRASFSSAYPRPRILKNLLKSFL